MMLYEGKIKNDYCLARVKHVQPESRGLVRTVTVCYRRRDSGESVSSYMSKPLVCEEVSVQRLDLSNIYSSQAAGCNKIYYYDRSYP